MNPVEKHPSVADVSFDGGDLDCGGGLLLLIRRHIDPLPPGGLLEILSTDASVEQDLPAWSRLTGNELVSWIKTGRQRSYLVCKGSLSERAQNKATHTQAAATRPFVVPVTIPHKLPSPASAPAIEPLSVMGIGSWPRPRWMLQALHEYLEGRLSEADFQATANDAVRLAVEAQLRAGVNVVTDGEQRRDSYASFVGSRLDNCQLIPLTDLTAMVDDREKFANNERFPTAEEVVVDDIPTWVARANLPPHAYAVIVTRGHTNDLEALRALAPIDLRYLGLIGSRAKVARIYEALAADNMPAERLERVHAPIGLDIGAVTPQEIAVSILAELIAVKHGKAHPATMKCEPGSTTRMSMPS
jgi:xanthine/CO dehydrogenase XdhC/CoxF family maturation factor